MFCPRRAFLCSLIAWAAAVTVLIGVSWIMKPGFALFRDFDSGLPSADPAGIASRICLWMLWMVCATCLLVIAPLLAQFRPGSLAWRAWLACPVAAILAAEGALAVDQGISRQIILPVTLACAVAGAAFTFSYVWMMNLRAARLAAPQPYAA